MVQRFNYIHSAESRFAVCRKKALSLLGSSCLSLLSAQAKRARKKE